MAFYFSKGRYSCLSTDLKLTDGIELNSLCEETDTGNEFIFNGAVWRPHSQPVSVAGSLASLVTLQSAQTLADNGTPYTATVPATLIFTITGTSTTRTIVFESAGPDGVYKPHYCYKEGDLTNTPVTFTTEGNTTKPISYKTEIPANHTFRARISIAPLSGNISISGYLVGNIAAPYNRLFNPLINTKINDYSLLADREKYQVWKANGDVNYLYAVYKNIAVKVIAGGKIAISTTGINGNYEYEYGLWNLPHYTTTGIKTMFILPWTRVTTGTYPPTSQLANNWRLCLVMNDGRVYHNFPSRSDTNDGVENADGQDIVRFDESVIWDLPTRKYPSSTTPVTDATVETYYPGLPSAVYTYVPGINVNNGYGNTGFGRSKTVGATTYPRFFNPKTGQDGIPLYPMGGYEPGDKVTLVGTYQAPAGTVGIGVRICFFMTDDGGRNWYCKYEFGGDDTLQNWINPIDTSAFANAYTASSFQLKKRTTNYPSDVTPEPADLFTWGSAVVISDISRASTAVVTTSSVHGLTTGNIIAIQDNSVDSTGAQSAWDWMKNETITTTSGGTGILFKVKVLTTTTFELYDMPNNPDNNIPCRHDHYVNKIKDGWLAGTGEAYPRGWEFLIQHQYKYADVYNVALATDTYIFTRLNSYPESVQRLMGMDMLDDSDNTIIFASDNENTTRDSITTPTGRTFAVSRGSTGIFKGKLADIDDMDKFTCVYNAEEVCYFFKKKAGVYIFAGQIGELALGFSDGSGNIDFMKENTGTRIEHFRGVSYQPNAKYVVIDNVIIAFK